MSIFLDDILDHFSFQINLNVLAVQFQMNYMTVNATAWKSEFSKMNIVLYEIPIQYL